MKDKINIKLDEIYHDPKTGYRGIQDLSRKGGVKQNLAQEYLQTQDVYTKHFPKKQKFQRRRFYSPGIDKIWQCDLVFMEPKWKKDNDDYLYLNLIIDTFSKYLWVVPLKTKKSSEVLDSFKIVFKQGRIPEKIHTDLGSEYIAQTVQNLFKSHNITWYTTKNETKAMIAERCALTLQQMMYRYLTDNGTTKWIDILDDLVHNYNNSYHSSIKMTPTEASNVKNQEIVYRNLYGPNSRLGDLISTSNKPKFEVGDIVRTHKFGTKFDRGYFPTFADEILFIKEVINSNPPVYKIVDYHNNEIEGTYYASELTKYNQESEEYEYEYILKTKKTDNPGIINALVKWKGYSDRFNSWVHLTPEQVQNSIFLHKVETNRKKKESQTRSKRAVAKGK